MTKKRSRSLFVLFTILLVVGLVACFISFTYPLAVKGNYYSYSNFISNLKLGEDVSSSYRLIYLTNASDLSVSQKELADLQESTMNGLIKIVQAQGYKDATAAVYGEDGIILHVGNVIDERDANTIKSLVGSPARLSFATSSDVEDAIIFANDISLVEANQYYDQSSGETTYYVLISFKDKDHIAEVTKDQTTLYIMLGDEAYTSGGMTIDEGGITDGQIMINGGFETLQQANTFANKIKSGMLDLELTCVDSAVVTPTYGIATGFWIAMVILVFVVASFVILIVRYRQIGLIACYNLLFFIVLSLLLVQSMPLAHFNFMGLLGLIVAYIVVADSVVMILEKAKQYYNSNTKLYIAFKAAQNDNIFKVLFNYGLIAVVGIVCVLLPITTVSSLGWALFVPAFVAMFTTLVLMRLFIKMYLAFNNNNGSKCNFHKGGKNA